jgi:hypothetical protein
VTTTRFVLVPLLGVALGALAAGCAQVDEKASSETYSPPVTRTGSNLPVGRERDTKAEAMTDAERAKLESDLRRTAPRRTGSN